MLKTPSPSPLVRVIDAPSNTFDKLYAPRLETWFTPNEDGSPSLSGRLRFYTQWWHFRQGVVFAKTDGPQVNHEFDSLVMRDWTLPDGRTIAGLDILLGMEAMFVELAGEALAPREEIPDTVASDAPMAGAG